MTTSVSTSASQRWTLAAVCLGAVVMPLSFTGPAVALPALAQALHASPEGLNWVTNAFMLAFGSTLLAAGGLADRHGRRRVFLWGAMLFVLASLALIAAPGIVVFDLLRAVQGLGGAAILSAGAAALAQEFEGAARTRAFSLMGTSFGVGLSFGPILSALLVAQFGWRGVFSLTALMALVAWGLGRRYLRESRDPAANGLDWAGAFTFSGALALLTWMALRAPADGWAARGTLGLLAGSALLFIAFVLIELRRERPLLDLTLFRHPRFVGVQLLAAAPAYGFVVLLILLPVRFIAVDGLDEVHAGLLMVALSAPLMAVPVLAGRLVQRFSAASLCAAGLLAAAAGLAWLSRTLPGADVAASAWPMLLIGAGMGLPWGLMDGLAVSVVPKERAGMAAGIFSTSRVAGEGLALAIVSAMLAALTARHLAAAAPDAASAGAAAQRLVAGDAAGAMALLPSLPRAELALASGQAFSALLWVLCAVTVATAAAVFLFIGREGRDRAGLGPARRSGPASAAD
ncbi:MFS transporter [Achromobacter spanius]|uniref:MFS transporter n=1 Tax=Achromobacter spanius TaxID=217203 RepID=UPI003208EFA3